MNKVLCSDVRLLLSLYIDDMLPDEEMTMVREHLESCDSCRDEYALLKGIMEQTKELPELEVSAEFKATLCEKIAVEAERKRARLEEKEEEQEELQELAPLQAYTHKRRIYPAFLATAAAIAISVFALSNLPKMGVVTEDNNAKSETAAPDMVLETLVPASEESAPSRARSIDNIGDEESKETANQPAAASLAADDVIEEVQTAKAADKGSEQKVQAVYRFDEDAIEHAREILKGYETENGGYVIPQNEIDDVNGRLKELSGYVSGDAPSKNADECIIILETE